MADSRAELLTSDELKRRSIAGTNKSLFFEDGLRRIDFVVVYKNHSGSEQAEQLEKQRQTYQQSLLDKGLQLEEALCCKGKDEYGTFKEEDSSEELHYVKIHAPFDVLCDTAEDMNMKMPTRESDILIPEWYESAFPGLMKFMRSWDPFSVSDSTVEKEVHYFVAKFDKERQGEFINFDQPDQFFSPAERSRLVYYILEKAKYGDGQLDLGLFNLVHNGVYLDGYPLHDGPDLQNKREEAVNDRQRLRKDWAAARRVFKYQPIHAIKNYFGEKVALYFAWLGFYTSFLLPAAIVGILCFIYGVVSSFDFAPVNDACRKDDYTFYMCPLCDRICSYYLLSKDGCLFARATRFFDNEATLFFALFMSLWATVYLEFWKRKQISLAHEWHTMDFEEEEERPRPEYLASVTRLKKNPVTEKMEPYMPARTRCAKLSGAAGVVAFFIVLVIAAVGGVIVFRAAFYVVLIASNNATVRIRSKMIVSTVAACINLIAINFLKIIYKKVAIMLTDWENPRTKTDYEDSFTVKMFWFQFVNTYASIFYIAFFKSEYFTGFPGKYKRFTAKAFRFDGCSVYGCFLELTIQLIIIMVGQQVIGNIMEIVLPTLKKCWKDRQDRLQHKGVEPQWEEDYECQMQDKFSLFWQYLEIVLQYGFVTMFVAAFPLAPFFALLNNLVEIRLDAINFVCNNRRPVANRAEDIGAWQGILESLTYLSVIVNAFVLAFTSELVPRLTYIYYKSENRSLDGYLDWSLSSFNVSEFTSSERPDKPFLNLNETRPYCRFPGYHNDDGSYSKDYWVLCSARLAFIFIFQFVVIVIKWLIAYIIPDIPESLRLKIKRENYLEAEALKDHKEKKGKRAARPSHERRPSADNIIDENTADPAQIYPDLTEEA